MAVTISVFHGGAQHTGVDAPGASETGTKTLRRLGDALGRTERRGDANGCGRASGRSGDKSGHWGGLGRAGKEQAGRRSLDLIGSLPSRQASPSRGDSHCPQTKAPGTRPGAKAWIGEEPRMGDAVPV